MDDGITHDERVTRIMFLREHRRALLVEYCEDGKTTKEKTNLRMEIARVQKKLRELDPDGIFPR